MYSSLYSSLLVGLAHDILMSKQSQGNLRIERASCTSDLANLCLAISRNSCKNAPLQLAPKELATTVFIALSSVCQFIVLCVICPKVQWLGLGARTLPPMSNVPGQLSPVEPFGNAKNGGWGVESFLAQKFSPT